MIGSNATVTRLWADAQASLTAQGATVVYPSGTPYSTQGNNMRLSPNTGMPAVTVPMGQALAADNTVTGGNVNLEFLGRDYSEGQLIGLAYSFEQATHARTAPAFFGPLG